MRPFRLLAVSAVLLTGVVGVPAVSETQVFANPQAQVSVYDGLRASVQGDSYTASPTTLWGRDFELRYDVQSGTVTGPSAQITLPNGLSDLWSGSSAPIHINWTGATNTLKGTWPGVPAEGTTMEVGASIPGYSVGLPPVSVSRSISDPVLTGDHQTRTVTLDVTVNSTLAAFNWFNANLISPWDIPQGMAYAVGSQTVPAGFLACPDPGFGIYYCPDPSALVVGNTYHFAADVQFNRTGVLSQGTVGDLYYKPESGVNYGVQANAGSASGTSMAITAATGVVATFSSLTPTDFTGNTQVGNSLELGVVAAGVGPATPSHIWVARTKGTSISGTTLHGVHVEVKGANIIEGTITAPGGAVYGLEYDYDTTATSGYFGFDFDSITESDLDGFTGGTYQLALKGSDGVTYNYTALVPDKDMPTEMPQFTQAMGFDTTDTRPTIGWSQATDPNVSKNFVQMEMITDEDGGYQYDEMVDKAVTSHTPTEDLGLGAWYAMVAYCDDTNTVTSEGVPLQIDFATYTDAYFNVTPEPAALALLAAGACALGVLRRRR